MTDPLDDSLLEEALVTRAIDGDREALTQLLKRYGPSLQERVRGEIGSRWQSLLDADDVLQVSFLECFLRIARFENRGRGSFEAWLSRICHHNMLDAFRSLERAAQHAQPPRRVARSELDSSRELFELVRTTSGTPSRKAMDRETHEHLRYAVAQLPRDYSLVLTLYDLEARSVDDVAKAMDRTTGAVYMLRARALDYLREALGSESRV